jgi:DNA polymerase-1
MGMNELTECWRMIDVVLRTKRLLGHNLQYDEYKMSLLGFKFNNVYSDTLIKVRVIFPEMPSKKLNDLQSLWTREPFHKEEGKEFRLGKSNISQLLRYNGKDCVVTFEIDEALEDDLRSMQEIYNVPAVDYYYNYMMRKHPFYLQMANNGFLVDLAKQLELKTKYNQMREEVRNRLTERIGFEVNVASPPQMFNLLYKVMKFKPLRKEPTGEDAIVRLMGNHAKKAGQKEILTDILEEKRIRTQLSRSINFSPDYDNRCKSTFNISATETCRSSTGILKKPIRPKKIGLGFHTIAKHGRLAKDIRSMLVCDKGMVLIQADASQAEPRVVAVLSEDYELLRAFDERVDIHRRTAGLLFGYTEKLNLSPDFHHIVLDNITKDGPERFTGKTVRNAGNYDVKKGTLMTTFNTNAQKFEINMTISEWKAGKMLEVFHDASPKIKSKFHQDIKDALDSSRVLIDPFGGVRVFNGRFDEDLYKEGYANIPQRTVAHLVQGGALKIEDELNGDLQHKWIVEAHDALVMSVPENNWQPYARLMKKHLETPIDFSTYCTLRRDYKLVIPAEIEISSTNYGNFEKVKL